MADWLDKVQEKEKVFKPLFDRMDKDRDILYSSPFVMMTLDGQREQKDVSNVTLPDGALFAAKAIAKLAGVKRQTMVEAGRKEMSDEETTAVENFLDDTEYEVDAKLNEEGEWPEFSTHSEGVCINGPIADQILTREENGIYIPDVRPLDTRYLVYEIGVKENWVAYKMFRDKSMVLEQYDVKSQSLQEENNIITGIWTNEKEIIYVNKQLANEQDNPYGKPPFVIQMPPSGSALKHRDTKKRQGESIFSLLRDLYPEINWIATLLKTMNYDLLKPPYQEVTEEGRTAKPGKNYPGKAGRVMQVDQQNAYTLIPKPDLKNFTRVFMNMIDRREQMASFSIQDFGSVTFPLPAVSLALLAGSKGELLLSRLWALALLYQQRSRMIIEQYLEINKTLELGAEGHRRKHDPSKLKGEYVIKYRYSSVSKEEQASDAAIANSMGGLVSEDYKRREILKLPDPDGEKMKIRAEQAERMDPVIALYEQGSSLIAQSAKGGDRADMKAKLILRKIESLLRPQPVVQPKTEEPKSPEPAEAKQLIPLFGGGGGGRGNATQRPEELEEEKE
ncbi:hypothetical protein LCGC14_0430960 [marine sediment metagenome]|uniref:Portal protein n=1 Tax=marine sediment metagenome TaxID=412755 RepID=A0A0F9VA33_9ZZZZ